MTKAKSEEKNKYDRRKIKFIVTFRETNYFNSPSVWIRNANRSTHILRKASSNRRVGQNILQ